MPGPLGPSDGFGYTAAGCVVGGGLPSARVNGELDAMRYGTVHHDAPVRGLDDAQAAVDVARDREGVRLGRAPYRRRRNENPTATAVHAMSDHQARRYSSMSVAKPHNTSA